MSSFSFRGFTLQTARPGEHYSRLARIWTEADPDHRETTLPSFWFEQSAGVESYILEDKFGVVFFFKMMRAPNGEIELHIQFPPPIKDRDKNTEQQLRVIRGLTEGLEWIERILAVREVHTLFFVSKSPNLVKFCEKRLGFVRDGERLVKPIQVGEGISSSAAAGNCG